MTRQMADDEVLRVLDRTANLMTLAAVCHPRDKKTREARAAVAALQDEQDALRAEVARLQVVVAKFHYEPRAMFAAAVASVLTTRAERAEAALEALRGQVAGLVGLLTECREELADKLADDESPDGCIAIDLVERADAALLAIKESDNAPQA